jgi:hypothetical protein
MQDLRSQLMKIAKLEEEDLQLGNPSQQKPNPEDH